MSQVFVLVLWVWELVRACSWVCSAGSVLRSLRRLWEGLGFRAVREGFWCSPPRLASDRSRSAWRMGRSAGTVLRSLRKLGGGWGFRAVREGLWCSLPRLASDRSRSAGRVGGSAGSVLRSLRRLGGGWSFRAVRDGFLVIASKACCGPIPLRLAYAALRGIGPALAEEARGRIGLSRFARGILVFASKARCGPIPLRFAYGGSAGSVPRAYFFSVACALRACWSFSACSKSLL